VIVLKEFLECLQSAGVEFFTGVPDSLLNDFCLYIDTELPNQRHVIAANEGNAVALAAGYHLATGTVPLVYMQNAGLGNAMNPLLSLTNKEVYAIPMVLLIGWRGDPSITDHPQHKKQGELTPLLLNAMDIPYKIINDDNDTAYNSASWAINTAREIGTPVALLAKRGVFAKDKKTEPDVKECQYSLTREEAIKCIINCVPKDTIFVATTGRATRELYDLRALSRCGHENDFLNVGAMGHASSIAIGLTLAQKRRLVVCLDGDGATIMHLGSLTTTGKLNLPNFLHIVLNNGAHESVGGQPTAGFKINLTRIAEGSGYKSIGTAVETEQTLKEAVKILLPSKRSSFLEVRIRKGIRNDLGPLKASMKDLKMYFMNSVKGNI
jgi:phosphonopyruvate decarboxylase